MVKESCLYYEKRNDMGATIHWCQNYPHLNFDCDKCERYIEKKFVRVVRCKDCKWFSANEHPQIPTMCQSKYEDGSSIYGTCLYATRIYPKPTDFCSWGERREDG